MYILDNVNGKIETRVLDERDFQELKQYADYYSNVTKVMSFNVNVLDKGILTLNKYFDKEYLSEKSKENCQYIVDFDNENKKIYLIAPDSYIDFCGGIKAKNGKLGFVSMDALKFVYILLKYDLVKPGENFMKWFSPLQTNALLSELHSFTQNTNFRKKRWSFKRYYKEELEKKNSKLSEDDLTPNGTDLFKTDNQKIPNFTELRLKIIDINYKDKKCLCKSLSNNQTFKIQKFGWIPFSLGCWDEGKDIRLLVNNIYNNSDEEFFNIINPVTLPEDIEIENMNEFGTELGTLINRRYPANLLNRMYFEYKIRRLLFNRNKGEE